MLSTSSSFIVPKDQTSHYSPQGQGQAGGRDSSLLFLYGRLFLPNSNKLSLSPYLISNPELSIFDRLAPGQPYTYN